jgi:hypothetical protein
MIEYLAVAGTHGTRREDEWNHLGSAFTRFMLRRGFVSIEERAASPFVWSTDLDLGRSHRDWQAGGRALLYYLVPPLHPHLRLPPGRTRLVAHSHGGQVALYAASYGLKVECLVTVGTPVRGDMREVAEAARPNIKRWLHLYSPRDLTQILGSLFGGGFRVRRRMPLADLNREMPKGHGDVLRDPSVMHAWVDDGWLAFVAGRRDGAPATPNSFRSRG